jgi:hypothetical protein
LARRIPDDCAPRYNFRRVRVTAGHPGRGAVPMSLLERDVWNPVIFQPSIGRSPMIYTTPATNPVLDLVRDDSTTMKFAFLLIGLTTAMWVPAWSTDLPTVSVDHLYYLRTRGEQVRKLTADDMIDYCIVQKIGGRAFEDLYSQLFQMRIDLIKLQKIEGLSDDDSRVKTLKKTYNAEYVLLSDEAQKIQRGLIREGVIAAETLEAMGRAQQGR